GGNHDGKRGFSDFDQCLVALGLAVFQALLNQGLPQQTVGGGQAQGGAIRLGTEGLVHGDRAGATGAVRGGHADAVLGSQLISDTAAQQIGGTAGTESDGQLEMFIRPAVLVICPAARGECYSQCCRCAGCAQDGYQLHGSSGVSDRAAAYLSPGICHACLPVQLKVTLLCSILASRQ